MHPSNQTGNTGSTGHNNGTVINGNGNYVGGEDGTKWVMLLIAFCTLVLTAAGVWVAAMR
jgi:hypothetical protein